MVLAGGRCLFAGTAEVEDRALARQTVGLLAPASAERLLEDVPASPSRAAPVESSAPHLTRVSSARLLTTCGSTRSQKSQIDANGPSASRRGENRPDGVLPDVLHGVEAEADFSFDHAKSAAEKLTSGGSTSIPISSQAAT